MKILLILILFNSSEGLFKATVGVYPTLETCEVAREEMAKKIKPEPDIYYHFSCQTALSTKGIRT